MRKHLAILLPAFLLLLSIAALGQETSVKGKLGGTIFDVSGAVVPGATVTLTGPTGNATTTSDSDGRFIFDLLTPGTYSVRAEMKGFKAVEVKQVQVFTNNTSTVRLSLEPGGGNEVVEVTASSVGVDTSSTKVESNLNDTFYENLPVARNITGLFYATAGVDGGGGTGSANPSIAGGSGLENQYVADGVNITDGAFGGIGVYSRVYGPLATGINLSFVKEVDVKTGGYEPQYGKSTGGLVQIVTKSGGNEYHGGVSAYFGPQQFEETHMNPDSFGRLNEGGLAYHQGAWDVEGELGGYVPGFKNHLFFFGSFNPSYNAYYDQFIDGHGVVGLPVLPNSTIGQTSYDYAGKLTWKINDANTIESSVFGDPTREGSFEPNNVLATFSKTTFDKLSNGTRNWVVRWNSTLSPTWLVNASFSWGHNYLTDTPEAPDVYQIQDLAGRTLNSGSPIGPDGGQLSGQYTRQGLGYYENTTGDNYGLSFDTQKVINKLGQHTLGVGYHYERNDYDGATLRTGPGFTITDTMSENALGDDSIAGLTDNAAFQLRALVSGVTGAPSISKYTGAVNGPVAPVYANVSGFGIVPVALLQVRGTFSNPNFTTEGRYHAAYVNDSWAIGRHITVNAGYRWEQQMMQGSPYTLGSQNFLVHYTYTDNWSPRFGLAIDPLGDRKTKIYGNFARYSYAIPLDMAIRSLSNEQDAYDNYWAPPSTGPSDGTTANLAVNPDGTLPALTLDDSTELSPFFVSAQSGEAIASGTKMQYLQEWVYGVEHEFPHGITVDVHYQDRRLKRIVEDMSGISPEGADAGESQFYVIGNPDANTDLFTNEQEISWPFPQSAPAACAGAPFEVDEVDDASGNNIGGACFLGANGGAPVPDGKPDGFVNPVRVYKALEVEINKSFSKGWQWHTNYRWSTLAGNYEGAFRNDNAQSDPSISSLFDFTAGQLGLLGDQFAIGFLNTDRRHILNNFVSYTFSSTFLKNLTVGTGVRIETGVPINDLRAHPVYQNAGEIPVGGRGALGRLPTVGEGDLHFDYKLKMTEKQSLQFGADLFNVSNQQTQERIDQNQDRSYGIPNSDFLLPVGNGNIGVQPGFQRPFYARLNVKWIF
jgi:Carboxypeptidase regulatory-like domain